MEICSRNCVQHFNSIYCIIQYIENHRESWKEKGMCFLQNEWSPGHLKGQKNRCTCEWVQTSINHVDVSKNRIEKCEAKKKSPQKRYVELWGWGILIRCKRRSGCWKHWASDRRWYAFQECCIAWSGWLEGKSEALTVKESIATVKKRNYRIYWEDNVESKNFNFLLLFFLLSWIMICSTITWSSKTKCKIGQVHENCGVFLAITVMF